MLSEGCKGNPVAVTQNCSSMDVFIHNTEGELLYKTWNGKEWMPLRQIFQRLGMPLNDSFESEPAVITRDENRLDIFIIGKTGKLYHKSLDQQTWQPEVGSNCWDGNFDKITPTVTNRDGLDIFLVGGDTTDNCLYHIRWDGKRVLSSKDIRPLHRWHCKLRVAALVREQDSFPEERGKWFF